MSKLRCHISTTSSGLSTAQASQLTSKPGGRQVAPNKIEWLADGVTVTHYRTYNLAYHGLPPYRHEGAYHNHRTGHARAILHADLDLQHARVRQSVRVAERAWPEHRARAVSART